MIRLRRRFDAAAVFLRQTHILVITRRWGDPFRRSSDSWLLDSGSIRSILCLPGNIPVTGFRQKKMPYHIQRRYRSGFSPDYLVQQPRFIAPAATELLSNCRKHHSTACTKCQQQRPPRQQKILKNQHSSRLAQGLPRISKPRKEPAWRRYCVPPFSMY